MEDFVQVLWADCTVLELLPTLSVLFSLAFVVNTIRVWRFNRGNLRQSAASHGARWRPTGGGALASIGIAS